MSQKVLLLTGSPKSGGSNSKNIGVYLVECLEKNGFSSEQINIYLALKSKEATQKLFYTIENVDLIILTFPVYVDSLPAPTIHILELIANYRQYNNKNKPKFVALSNCGFPEALHCNTALEICRSFANEVGFEWVGGMAYGGGEALNGKSLKEAGGIARNLTKSLELAANDLSSGKPISEDAIKLITKPVIPNWLYTVFGGFGWKLQAKKYNAHKHLMDRPYKP